jgi:outer membrane lipoprotein-sorting protein
MIARVSSAALLAVFVLACMCRGVQAADMTAYQIVKKSEDLLDQAKDGKADMLMVLLNKKGERRERVLNAYVKRYGNNRSKSIIFFRSPADVKGTSFLVWTDENKKDRQWLYLPALQRVRQISASGKGESFMGTEFTFYDMGGHDIDDYTYTLLREEAVGGEPCYVIEAVPKKVEFYSRLTMWIRKGSFVPAKTDFYDVRGQYEKQGVFTAVKNIQGINTPTRIEMHNKLNGRSTVIEFRNVVYDSGLNDDIFTERYMTRGG